MKAVQSLKNKDAFLHIKWFSVTQNAWQIWTEGIMSAYYMDKLNDMLTEMEKDHQIVNNAVDRPDSAHLTIVKDQLAD